MTTQQRREAAHDGPGRPRTQRADPGSTPTPSAAPAPGAGSTPTRDEIERAIAAHAQTRAVGDHVDEMAGLAQNLRGLMHGVAGPLVESAAYTAEGAGQVWEGWDEPSAAAPALWTDLRPSEATRLMDLVYEAVDKAVPVAEAVILAAVLEAGERFGAEFPEATRVVPAST